MLKIPNQPIYLAITSGKGGVGKSTISLNLAVAMAELGLRVGLVDADIYGFSIPALLGLRADATALGSELRPPEKLGIKVMSSGFLRSDNQPVVMRGPMLGKVIRTFVQQVEWGELDVLMFDMPPGTGDIPLDLHQLLPSCKEMVVTTPHEAASEVAFRAGAMTARTGHELLGVIENMSYMHCACCEEKVYPFGTKGGDRLAKSLRTEVLARLPLQAPSEGSGNASACPGVYEKNSEAGRIIRQLAEEVSRFILTAKKVAGND